jgi:integrase
MAAKVWATPLQTLLFAERCSALSGSDTDFVMAVTMAYTGMRWSEAIGLRPACLRDDKLDIDWKLYELHARFYQGRPKDGSIRSVDLAPFLADLLDQYLSQTGRRACTCTNAEPPWCSGGKYVFLGPGSGHFRRSNYSTRIVRPAADGWYPERKGPATEGSGARHGRSERGVARRCAITVAAGSPGEPYEPPTGRGIPRLAGREGWDRCAGCGHTIRLGLDGLIGSHKIDRTPCAGTGAGPAEPMALASWLPLCTGLTPHGLRHGHQTWLDDLGIRYVPQSERMGHEVPGMRGVYGHITPGMRADLRAGLQEVWDESLAQRARLAPTSSVPVLDALLAPQREPTFKIHSQLAARIGHRQPERAFHDREAGR